jgi:hypothetical protein
VCRLKKALYGLKQASRAWYEKMDGFLMSLGFNKSVVYPNLYYHIDGNECLIWVLNVDNLWTDGLEPLLVPHDVLYLVLLKPDLSNKTSQLNRF